MPYTPNWNLTTIFSGGSQSPALKERMNLLNIQTQDLNNQINDWLPNHDTNYTQFKQIIILQEKVTDGFSQCANFINALMSENTADEQAKILMNELYTLLPAIQLTETIFTKKLIDIPAKQWENLRDSDSFKPIAFRLDEIRHKGKKLLSEQEENIINTLALDGLNAWSSHYDTIVSTLTIDFKNEQLSAGQAFNRMMSDPNPTIRAELFDKWETIWQEKSTILADTLNHLDGFRLNEYKLHGVSNFLEEPLTYNRMSEQTLNTMWQTIEKNKPALINFLNRKAKILGKEKMDWQDQNVPLILGELKEKQFSFDEAATFIIENFEKFSPKMASFAKKAFEKQWIEAENRPGKRPGGYCTELPETKESRIFMTFGNSINEVSTLAHELGHAFHSSVMWDLPALNRSYAMNVAETASTFAELIVADATLKEATTDEEKINLLDTKLQNTIAMFMNIHARFIFEKNFYAARQNGLVSSQALSELMLSAQKESFHDSLGSYHPLFWASKLHFFIDDIPFYNFPYTFGYLFSLGIYAYANTQKDNFEEQYIALLRDTAAMTSEELAQKHLSVDLTQSDFWQSAIDQVLKDIDTFMALTEDKI